MAYRLVTGPAIEPVTLGEAESQLNINIIGEDAHIRRLMAAARRWAEGYCERAFISQTWALALDEFPADVIEIGRGCSSITTVGYFDIDNDAQTLAVDDDYDADVYSEPARLMPVDVWPTTYARMNAVTITFVAGYGTSAASVPQDIRDAILMTVSHWYTTREPVVKGTIVQDAPLTVKEMLAPYRMGVLLA